MTSDPTEQGLSDRETKNADHPDSAASGNGDWPGGENPQPAIEEVSVPDLVDTSSESGFEMLDPAYVRFEQRTSYIVALVVTVIAVSVSTPLLFMVDDHWWIALAWPVGFLSLLAGLAYGSHFWPKKKYRFISWRLDPTGMEIRRGVFWKHRVSIPIARVQHVDVSQGPVQRMFELSTITIYTAGTKNSSVELEGLKHEVAVSLRDELIMQKEALDVT
ncbi:MAG: PH domain-containing protein [Aureliella sp.]